MNTGWFTTADFVSDFTRENTAKVRKIPGEQVQDRLHVVVVVIFPDPTYLKIGTLKRGERLHVGKKKKENCTYGTDLSERTKCAQL